MDHVWLSVGGAVYDASNDTFLLIRRADNGNWELPGGLVEPGEELMGAVAREVKEETGVEVEALAISGIYESPSHAVVSIVFLCRYLSGSMMLSDETVDVAWVGRSEISKVVNSAYSCRLLDVLEEELFHRVTNEMMVTKTY